MPLFQTYNNLNQSEAIADFLLYVLEEDRDAVPRMTIPQILLQKTRPGLNAELISSTIISRFNEIGIPSGPLEGNTPNVMELLVKVMCEEIVDAIQNQMRVDIAVDAGIKVVSAGANAAGPVASNGSSVKPHTATGVAR